MKSDTDGGKIKIPVPPQTRWVSVALTVAGMPGEVREFLHLCQVIQRLGREGHSAAIILGVDGDGSGKLDFSFNGEALPSSEYTEKNEARVVKNHIDLYLGG